MSIALIKIFLSDIETNDLILHLNRNGVISKLHDNVCMVIEDRIFVIFLALYGKVWDALNMIDSN